MKDALGHGSNARGEGHRDMNGRPLQEGDAVEHPGYPTYGKSVVTRTYNEAGSGRPLVTIKTTSGISATHDPSSLVRKRSK